MWLVGEDWGGETMREGAGEERGRSLRRLQPARRQGARPGRRGRELVAWVGVARARGGRTMTQPGLAGQEVAARAEEAAEGGEDGRGSLVAQVAGAERRRSAERAGGSGRRQTGTLEEAAGGRKEREIKWHLLTHRMTRAGSRCLYPRHRHRHRQRPTTRRLQLEGYPARRLALNPVRSTGGGAEPQTLNRHVVHHGDDDG